MVAPLLRCIVSNRLGFVRFWHNVLFVLGLGVLIAREQLRHAIFRVLLGAAR
jgi:hypothetical protein